MDQPQQVHETEQRGGDKPDWENVVAYQALPEKPAVEAPIEDEPENTE